MERIEIAQEEWKSVLNEISENYKGKMAHIEILDDEHYRKDYSESIAFNELGLKVIDEEHITVHLYAGELNELKGFIDRTERISLAKNSNEEIKEIFVNSSLGRSAVIKFNK